MRSEPAVPEWSSTISSNSRLAVCVIDMQKFFITDASSPWVCPELDAIVPNVGRLIEAAGPHRSIFTMFMPPVDWQTESGSWRTYYYYNRGVTTEVLGTKALEIIDDLSGFVGDPAARVAPKKTASAFSSRHFSGALEASRPLFLVVCGIETDYCVLATALDALNQGYYVVIPTDACATSRGEDGQRNAEGVFERFPEQLWLTSTDQLIRQIAADK